MILMGDVGSKTTCVIRITLRGTPLNKKGTGLHLGAKCLNSYMGDFNSWRSMQQVGMP
jgi:hypothetical protein